MKTFSFEDLAVEELEPRTEFSLCGCGCVTIVFGSDPGGIILIQTEGCVDFECPTSPN